MRRIWRQSPICLLPGVRRRYRWLLLAVLWAAAGVPLSSAQSPLPATLTPSELFEKVSPCVVKITSEDEDGRPIATGSGFVILARPDANPSWRRWIVTNHHVIRAAVSATTNPPFVDSKHPSGLGRLDASVQEVVAENERNDLAVVAGYGTDVASLPMGDETLPPIGTRIFVISSPEGLKNTLSEGLVSGLRERENGEQWIQITAPISPGSSGGPVLTTDGRVIGVVVASHEEGQNLNFAVPVRALRRLLDAKTEPRPIWKGVSIREEESDAFNSTWVKLRIQVCGAGSDDWFIGACKDKVRAKAESGDQLALLLQARDEYDHGFVVKAPDEYDRSLPEYCAALPMLKRAVQEKPTGEAYLAHYLLGKRMSELHFCAKCIIQSKLHQSVPLDELRLKCYDPAITLLKKSTELNPKSSPPFARLAEVYLKTERYPEALVAAEFLVALVPNCWEAHLLRGKAFAHLRRIGAADEDFSNAATLRPGHFDLYKEVFDTFLEIGEHRIAIDASTRALSLPLPTNEEDLSRRQQDRLFLWYNAGLTYERMGDLENAARAFEEAKQLSPGRIRPSDVEERIARLRAGHPGDGSGSGSLIVP